MSSKTLFKVHDKVFIVKRDVLPWPGEILGVIKSKVPFQSVYNVHLYGFGRFKCLSQYLFLQKEYRSELKQQHFKKCVGKVLKVIDDSPGSPVVNKDPNRTSRIYNDVCVLCADLKLEDFKIIEILKLNKKFLLEPYTLIPSTELLTEQKFKDEYPISNDVFSRKPILLTKKYDYEKQFTENQNNNTADENMDTNEANSNIIDKRSETFETIEAALESMDISPNNDNEITSNSNNNSNTHCVSSYGRIINKTIFFNQQNITNSANKRYNNKQISKTSKCVLRSIYKRRTKINFNQQKIIDAAKALKDVTKADKSSDMGAASHSRVKSKSKISQLNHSTSNTKNKSIINNLSEVVDVDNITFLKARVDILNYLCKLENSLKIDNADYTTALNMLILIHELSIDLPMILKNPTIFYTFKKLSNYVGSSTSLKEYKQIVQIKEISQVIFFKKIQSLFVVPVGATFEGAFNKALNSWTTLEKKI